MRGTVPASLSSRGNPVMAQSARNSGKRKRKPKPKGRAVGPSKNATEPKHWLSRYGLACIAVAVVIGAVIITTRSQTIGQNPDTRGDDDEAIQLLNHAYTTDGPRTLNELLALPDDELEQLDLAVMNLVCAEGLPGAEGLDIDATLATLDEWARHVQVETDRHLYKYHADPAAWDHSEARWRMGMLVTALQMDCGVHYNMARARDVDFTKSQDLFIHGMVEPGMEPVRASDHPDEAQALLDATNGGTCVSMPVLYTAVARRLGYPVFLSSTKGHLFCRWDGRGHEQRAFRDYFNIEGTNRGINIYDDAHYLTWPFRISQDYADHYGFLQSEDAKAVLAGFMATRGHCLMDTGNLHRAIAAYRQAAHLAPDRPHYQQFMAHANMMLLPPDMRPGFAGGGRPSRTGTGQHRTIDQELAWIQQMNEENQRRQEAMLQEAHQQPYSQGDPFYAGDLGQQQPNDPFYNPALPNPAGFP